MEIGKVGKNLKTTVSKSKKKATTEKTESKKSNDSIEFSTELNEINQLKKKMETTEDIRLEKVDDIKEKINSGEYQVNSEKVAEKIVDEFV